MAKAKERVRFLVAVLGLVAVTMIELPYPVMAAWVFVGMPACIILALAVPTPALQPVRRR